MPRFGIRLTTAERLNMLARGWRCPALTGKATPGPFAPTQKKNRGSGSIIFFNIRFNIRSTMADSYRALHYHVIFSTKGRESFLSPAAQSELHKYFGGAIHAISGIPLAIGGAANHVHLLFSAGPNFILENFIKEIKRSSNKWLKEKQFVADEFAWQLGYGAFTISRWDLDKIAEYVRNQDEHHKKTSFESEFRALLKRHGVDFDEKYMLG